jgi:hypothetical protein
VGGLGPGPTTDIKGTLYIGIYLELLGAPVAGRSADPRKRRFGGNRGTWPSQAVTPTDMVQAAAPHAGGVIGDGPGLSEGVRGVVNRR